MTATATPLPEYVQIEPVGECNLHCRMCPILYRKEQPGAFMPFDKFISLINQFEGLRELHLQGLGEPLMHPRFFDMVRYAAARGIRVTTNTNLTLLNSARAEQCVTSGLDVLHVSLDAVTPEKYEYIRTGSRWRWILSALERLHAARRRHAAQRPGLHLVAVLMKNNLQELPGIVRFAARWSFEEVFVQHLSHDFGEPSLPDRYTPLRDFVRLETLSGTSTGSGMPDTAAVFEESRALAREHNLRLRLPSLRPKRHAPGTPGRQRCDWPWRGAYISYDGFAMPCCMVSTPDRIHFGNAVRDGVASVWDNAPYTRFRAELESEHPPAVCHSCSLYHGTF